MRYVAVIAAILMLLPAATLAQRRVEVVRSGPEKGFEEQRISKAALAGQEIRVWAAQMIDPNCQASGSMETRIVEPPKHGEARVSEDAFFGGFPLQNPRYRCNSVKSPGRQVFYRSADGFHGHDKVVFQNSTSEGRIRKWVVDIDVR